MIKRKTKKGLILASVSFSRLEPETCCSLGFFVKTMKEKDQVLIYLNVRDGLTGLAGQCSDKASNVVRNVAFLKHRVMILLSRYFIENRFCRNWESYC